MEYKEYCKHVDASKFTLGDFGRWVRFGDSYPPVSNVPYRGTTVEFLLGGDPSFEDIYTCTDGTVRFRDYDNNNEALEWGMWEDYYWRFVPDPPGNEGYNVG